MNVKEQLNECEKALERSHKVGLNRTKLQRS
jgi:hypothetical protein